MDIDRLQALSADVGALLQSRGAKLLERLKSGAELLAFRPQVLSVGGLRLITTSLVAEGGYSFVYTARELMPGTEQGRLFALKKVIAQDAETLEIARAEQSLLATLPPHPHIVRYFGGSVEQRRQGGQELYMVLEYCPHGSLVDLVLPGAPVLSEARLLSVFHSVCKAVAHLHSQQPPIAHRDLKLENVLCNASGLFKLCDFGSVTTRRVRPESRAERLREEETISKCSTLMYRAPEMVNLYAGHEISEAVDVWALGCVLYTLAFRRHPFDAGTELQIVNAAVAMPRDSPYSADVHALITYALESDPQKRPTVFELIARVVARRARVLDAEFGPGADNGGGAEGYSDGDGSGVGVAQVPPPNWGAPRELAQSEALQHWDTFADGAGGDGGSSPARASAFREPGAAEGALASGYQSPYAQGTPAAGDGASSSASSILIGGLDGGQSNEAAAFATQLVAFEAAELGGVSEQGTFAAAASAPFAFDGHMAQPSLAMVTPPVTSTQASLSRLPTAPLLAPPPGAPAPASLEGRAAAGAHSDLLSLEPQHSSQPEHSSQSHQSFEPQHSLSFDAVSTAPSLAALAQPSLSEPCQQAPSAGFDETMQFGDLVGSPQSQALFPPPPAPFPGGFGAHAVEAGSGDAATTVIDLI